MEYYERNLESFSDETITRVSRAESWDGWYAALDVGPDRYVSDPDYARAAKTRAEAIAQCARAIRSGLESRMDGYSLRFRLFKHWTDKERG